MTQPTCTCAGTSVAEMFARLIENKPPTCPVHQRHGEEPDPGASGAPALNSPALEQSLAAALGATIHTN